MATLKTLTINGITYTVAPLVSSVTLRASAWEGSEGAYYQVVNVPGVTSNSKVDLQPTPEQLVEFHNKDLAFTTENDGGVVTVHAIGDKPKNDHTIQITLKTVNGFTQDDSGNIVVGGEVLPAAEGVGF